MDIQPRGQANSGVRTNAQSTCSFSFNNVSGDFLVLVVKARDTSPYQSVSTTTKPRWGTTGGDANDGRFTFRNRATSGVADIGWIEFWHLKNVPTGTHNMDVTLDGNVDFSWVATLLAFSGVDPTLPWHVPEQTQVVTSQVALSLNDYGSLQDEKDAYGIYGWTFTGGQLPTIANGPYTVSGGIDVHSALEADDLWQNIVMARRIGVQGYTDLATAWAAYYKNNFLADFTGGSEPDFGYDHTFGWGLIEWATLISDSTFLTAANAIANIVQAFWYNTTNSNGYRDGFYSLRGPGRHLLLACKLNRRQWADDIWNGVPAQGLSGLKTSWRWSERTISGGIDIGFWSEDPDTFSIYPGNTGSISSFEFGILNNGLTAYYELTGDTEVKRRLILMARFAQFFGLEPNVNHTGTWIICDFPGPGQFLHRGLGAGIALQPFYTCTLINTLVRGYILTGDTALLTRASLHWDRSSRATDGDTYPYTNRPAEIAGQVGHFMNKVMQGTIFYASDGEITYGGLLFKAVASLNPNFSTPNPPSGLTALATSSSQITLHWVDNSNNETGFIIQQAVGAGAFSQIASIGADINTFNVSGLNAAQLYRYQVCAFNNNGNSAFSNIAQDTTASGGGGTIPNDPTSLVATAISYSQINLTWVDNSTNENNFLIQRKTGAGAFAQIAAVAAGVQSFSDFTVAANTSYDYRVNAVNASGPSANYTNTASATTPATTEAWTVLPNSSWRTIANAQSYITPGNTPDGKSDNIENILNCWSSGLIFQRPNGEQWLIIKNGGHDSWFWNDVWGYRINGGSPGWNKLRSSFLPYISVPDWDNFIAIGMDPNTGNLGTAQNFNIYTDGSPGNAHTYDMCGYIPATDECWYFEGAHTNGSAGRSAPIHFFSMVTHNYRYGQNWFSFVPEHFAVTDTLPNGHILIDSTRLQEYDPVGLTVTNLNTNTQPEYVQYSTGRYVNGKMYVFGPKTALDPQFGQGIFCKIHEVGVQGETIMNTSGAFLPSYAAPGVCWEPDINQFVIWAGNRDVGFLDPATGIKTIRTVPGADPGVPIHFATSNHTGTYKRFDRIASGTYILMNSIDEVHKLTLDFSGFTPPTGIQFNSVSDLQANDGSTVSLTNQHNCSGSDRYGLVAVLGDNNQGGGGVDGINGVTWGGNAMTLLRKKISGFPDTDARMMYLFGIVAPPTGPQDIVITANAPQVIYGLSIAYTGVAQVSPAEAQTDHASPLPTSSTLTSQLATITDNDWIVMFEQSYDNVTFTQPSQGSGDVRRISLGTYANMSFFDSNGPIHPASTYSMTTSRSVTPTVRGITHVMVALKPA